MPLRIQPTHARASRKKEVLDGTQKVTSPRNSTGKKMDVTLRPLQRHSNIP
jgi:hypothetical protein